MGSLKISNLEAENQFSSYQISQKIIKFLLSVSLFSLLFPSLPFLLHSLNAFLMKIFSYSISKNYMFLLCNGLLVFIVKNSGLIHGSSSPTAYQTQEIVKNNVGETQNSESKELEITEPAAGGNEEIEFPVEEESLITVKQKDEILNSEESGEVGGKEIMTSDEESEELEITGPVAEENGEEIESPVEEDEESLVTVEQKDEILNSEEEGDGEVKEIVIIDEDVHDVEETEELNRKCEDFIRRMKAGFCSKPRTWNYSHEFDQQRAIMAI